MYNLQATLREITVLDLPVTEITVEVVDVPMFLDLSPSLTEITVEVVDLPLFLDMSADMLPPPPEVVYLDLDNEIDFPDPFPTLSPRDLGLHVTHL